METNETNQTTTVAAPIAQVVTETAPIKVQTVELDEEGVFGLTVLDTPRTYSKGPNEGEEFYLFRFRGASGTCTKDFQEAHKLGQIIKITLTEGEYLRTVVDPLVAGGTKEILQKTWNLDGYATADQMVTVLDNSLKVAEKRATLQSMKTKAAGAVKLTDTKVAAIAV